MCSSEDDSKDQYRPQFKLKHSIPTVLQKISSHCKPHLQLMSVLIYTYIHTCHTHTPLLPQYNLQDHQQQPPRCFQSPRRPQPWRCIRAVRPLSSLRAARWYLVISTDSPHINEYFRSIQSSKHWCSKKCSQLCFLKDTEMLTLLSILQRCQKF